MNQMEAIAAANCRACLGSGCSFCLGRVKDVVLAEQRARIVELEAEVARLKDGASDALAAYRRGFTPETTLEELLAPYKEDQHGE